MHIMVHMCSTFRTCPPTVHKFYVVQYLSVELIKRSPGPNLIFRERRTVFRNKTGEGLHLWYQNVDVKLHSQYSV